MDGDMIQLLSNGVPTSVRIYNTPLTHRENMNPDLGWFLQDSWRVNKRLTLNLGIRFDYMLDEHSGAGRTRRLLGSRAIVPGPERNR